MKNVLYGFILIMVLIFGLIEGSSIEFTKKISAPNITKVSSCHELNSTNNIQQFVDLNILESLFTQQANHLTLLMSLFIGLLTILITVASVFAYFKSKSLIDSVNDNRNTIKKLNDKLEEDISLEVSKQIIHNTKDLVSKTEEYAYREISGKLESIISSAQESLFSYQKVVYQINETKKIDYEKALNNNDMDIEKRIDELIFIQNKYNEINNQTVPKLFSKNINRLIEAAEKLAEYKELNHIIANFLKELLKKDTFTWADKYRIKDVLKNEYGVDIDKEKEIKDAN